MSAQNLNSQTAGATPGPDFSARLLLRIRYALFGSLFAAIVLTALSLAVILYADAFAPLRASATGWSTSYASIDKFVRAIGLLVVPVLFCIVLFWVMLRVQMKILLRPANLLRAAQAGMEVEMQRAEVLSAGISDQVLADMRQRGSSPAEITKMEQQLASVARKVTANSQHRLAQYQQNPELLAHEIRGGAVQSR
jgi:hypothetical protein